jgi:hypothetical protein
MSIIKLITTVSLAVALITMIASDKSSIYALATTEDDGWVEGDDDSQGEISSQEELEEAYEGTQWEDDIGPNEFEEATDDDDDDDNDGDDGNDNDGNPNPYCDTAKGKAARVCHDRLDYDQETGLYPCNDGTQKTDWRDCKDATKKNNDNNDDDSTKSIQSTVTASKSVEEASCRLIGSTDGIQQKFDSIKFQSCGLYLNGQKAYSDGFISGCAQGGNTQVICQALVDSSILNAKTQLMQTSSPQSTTQTTAIQSTQAIQPAAVN